MQVLCKKDMLAQKLYRKKFDFRFPGLLMYFLLSPVCHNLCDKIHTLIGFITIIYDIYFSL